MKTLCLRRAGIISFVLAVGLAPLAGAWAPIGDDGALRPVPENWEARMLLRETIFASVRDAAAAPRRIVPQTEAGDDVSFEAEVQEDAVGPEGHDVGIRRRVREIPLADPRGAPQPRAGGAHGGGVPVQAEHLRACGHQPLRVAARSDGAVEDALAACEETGDFVEKDGSVREREE